MELNAALPPFLRGDGALGATAGPKCHALHEPLGGCKEVMGMTSVAPSQYTSSYFTSLSNRHSAVQHLPLEVIPQITVVQAVLEHLLGKIARSVLFISKSYRSDRQVP